ncbi:uncharacterized protein [Rutidosis leptorrhynchoides]|uniref:uncharacterized protein n=1 Tax=Rutidosis leptorrhynchoides TaxID=125765 RepID=UPI003A9A5834
MVDIVGKLRLLTSHLKSWISLSRSNEATQLKSLEKKINDIDFVIDAGNADADLVQLRNRLFNERDDISKLEAIDSIQKSRIKWDVEGDENSKVFITLLNINVFDEHKTGASFSYIEPHYKLDTDEASFLEREVDDMEIKRAVWDCGSSKAPGPDVGCFYKIVTNILTNRILHVIDKLISPAQSAFISGRQILDGPMMLSEIISWYKKSNRKMLMFKVDFEKAYDSVNWDYLIFMLSSMGFGQKWCEWIMGCLKSAKTLVLVNGSPTREFDIKRGL